MAFIEKRFSDKYDFLLYVVLLEQADFGAKHESFSPRAEYLKSSDGDEAIVFYEIGNKSQQDKIHAGLRGSLEQYTRIVFRVWAPLLEADRHLGRSTIVNGELLALEGAIRLTQRILAALMYMESCVRCVVS